MLDPYIKSRGTRATEMSSNAALITMETYVQQGETSFSYMSQNVKKMHILGYLGALRGSSIIRLGLSCFPAILSPISMYMSSKETI